MIDEILQSHLEKMKDLKEFSVFQQFKRVQAEYILVLIAGVDKSYVRQNSEVIVKMLEDLQEGFEVKIPIELPFTPYGEAIDAANGWIHILRESLSHRLEAFKKVLCKVLFAILTCCLPKGSHDAERLSVQLYHRELKTASRKAADT